MKTVAMLVGALTSGVIVTSNAEINRSVSKCEQRCHDYHCFSSPNQMYCKWACQEKCKENEHTERNAHSKKH